MSALSAGRLLIVLTGLPLTLAARAAHADSPSALLDPDAFRDSITEEGLRDLGYDPEQYNLEVPLSHRLTVQRSYLRAGEAGLLSTGLTEHGTDLIRFSLNPRATLELAQDEARTALYGLNLTTSRKRTATFTQGFGKGTTAGTFSLLRTDTYASQFQSGFARSQTDAARLSLGLTKSLALSAGAEESGALSELPSGGRKLDVALVQPDTGAALAEFHQTESRVGAGETSTTQMALRTPSIEVGDVASLSASLARTDSSATGTDTTDSVNLSATPTDEITVTASHMATDRELSPDTDVTSVGSQIRLRPDLTVSAGFAGTETEGVGVGTQRSFALARTPADGKGLGLQAAYTDIGATNAEIDPTVDVRLTYAAAEDLQLSGQYHDDNSRPSPELAAGAKLPVLGGALDLSYAEYSFEPTTSAVLLSRSYGAQVTRSLVWGLGGRAGYHRTDSLADPTVADRIVLGLGGENDVVGKVDVQYETAEVHTPLGTLPSGSTITLSLARNIGVAELALSGKRTLPPGPPGTMQPDHQVQIDLKAVW